MCIIIFYNIPYNPKEKCLKSYEFLKYILHVSIKYIKCNVWNVMFGILTQFALVEVNMNFLKEIQMHMLCTEVY